MIPHLIPDLVAAFVPSNGFDLCNLYHFVSPELGAVSPASHPELLRRRHAEVTHVFYVEQLFLCRALHVIPQFYGAFHYVLAADDGR